MFMIKHWIENLINYLLPICCSYCSNLLSNKALVCHECWPKLTFISAPLCACCGYPFNLNISDEKNSLCLNCIQNPPHYDSARSLIKYDDISRKIIHHFKYYDKTHLAEYFSQLLQSQMNNNTEYHMVIPIPMHRLKRLFRLYNPAQILAQSLGNRLSLPVRCDILSKTKLTKTQTKLTKKQRIKNLRGSFKIHKAEHIKGKSIILVDDVITTGTTIELCAKLLRQAGAAEIHVCSIARTVLNQ